MGLFDKLRGKPKDVEGWCRQAAQLAEKGQTERAVEALNHALEAEPTAYQCVEIGQAYQQMQRHSEALHAFNLAHRKNPTSADVCRALGLALAESGQVGAGVEKLRQACLLAPRDANTRVVLASWLIGLGEVTEAIDHLSVAVERKRTHQPAFALLARALRIKGDYKLALDAGRRAVELRPDDSQAKVEVGIALGKLRLNQDAFDVFQSVVQAAGSTPAALVEVAGAFQEIGDQTTAVRYLREAICRDPAFVPGHIALGNALLDSGFPGAAVAILSHAARIDPDSATLLLKLGIALEQHGDLEGAEATLRHASELAPKDAEIRRKLQQVRTAPRRNSLPPVTKDRPPDLDRAVFVGQLETYPVSALLEHVKERALTGVLFLTSRAGTGLVRFIEGKITAACAPRAERIGDILRKKDGVSEEQIARMVRLQQTAQPDEPLGLLMVKEGIVSAGALRRALIHQVTSAVGEVIGWSWGTFAFERPGVAEQQLDQQTNVRLDVEMVLRVIDEQEGSP